MGHAAAGKQVVVGTFDLSRCVVSCCHLDGALTVLWRDGLVMLECVFSLLGSALLCGVLCPPHYC